MDQMVTKREYDVVVVGGGPAGSTAAYAAATRGLKTLLIDKTSFPRDKLCGGLLTGRSKALFERIHGAAWDASLINASNTISFYAGRRCLETVPATDDQTLYFCTRRNFDAYLLGLAGRSGAELALKQIIKGFDFDKGECELVGGERIAYGVLIGADGVNSQIARELFGQAFNPHTIGFGLEVEVPIADLPNQADNVEIDFAATKWGYGWIFPKQRTYTVGVGGIHELNPDMKDRLDTYLCRKGLSPSKYKVKGQYIPFGDYRKTPGKGNVLLCGDAAGVVDPITGEGIAYALETGELAARSAADAIRKGREETAFELYRSQYRRTVRSLDEAKRWRYLIFPRRVQRTFAWAFSHAGTLQKGYLDVLSGKHSYGALYWLFVIQTAKAILKPFKLLWKWLWRKLNEV